MEISKKWNEHLRRASRRPKVDIVRCPQCGHEIHVQTPETTPNSNPSTDVAFASFEAHFAEAHAQLFDGKASEAEKTALLRSQWEVAQAPADRDGGKLGVSSSEAGTNAAVAGEGVQPYPSLPSNRREPVIGTAPPAAAAEDRRKSPTPSIKREGSRSRSGSPPKRSKPARHAAPPGGEDSRDDFDRGSYQKGKLWSPDDDTTASRPRPYDKSNVATHHQRQRPSSGSHPKPHRQSHPPPGRAQPPPPADDEPTEIIMQPVTRPISQEQLVAEVKGIYAGLVMVESKCIEVDNDQSSQNDPANKLNNDQWQALIALHRTLLHEHHDFFLASQHPSASPALRRLAAKYAMPARMWRHGIHSFLELLRHRLPASLDHMLTFIYMAYSMMALLYETVPAFEDTWIECLGDLGRYRMAIEDDDIRDREVWTSVSRHWYSRASDKEPTTGRLYHHLAILARPNALQQLYYYAKSLCVEMPFLSARESIMTLFEPIMSRTPSPQQAKLPPTELNFVKAHGILFSGKHQEELDATMGTFFELLDNHIGRSTRRWIESGYHMSIANICAVTGCGDDNNPIAAALKAFSRARPISNTTAAAASDSQDQPTKKTPSPNTPKPSTTTTATTAATTTANTPNTTKQLPHALRLFTGTYDIVCRRFRDPNILPFLHVTLVFVHHLTFCPDAMAHLAPVFNWKLTALQLNTLLDGSSSSAPGTGSSSAQNVLQGSGSGLARLLEVELPFPGMATANARGGGEGKGEEGKDGNGKVGKVEESAAQRRRRPLPDDFAMRGFPWVEKYFPDGWFITEERIDDDEKYFEVPSMLEERRERVIWLGRQIAEREGGKWLRFDRETKRFGVNPTYEVELELDMPLALQMPATPGESVDYGELPDAGAVA